MKRREFTKGALLLAAGSLAEATLPVPVAVAESGLSGRRTGLWMQDWMPAMPALLALIKANFNQATIGQLKWDFVRTSPTVWDFSKADKLIPFCQQNDMVMHGHNLCWNATYPSWLPSVLTPSNAAGMLQYYISTVMTRYKGVIRSYDVVNEPISIWDGRPDGLSTGPWLTALGPEYIDIAFHAAAAADPSALLVLNTSHVEQQNCEPTQALTLALVEGLLSRGVPVQAIGLESHLFGTIYSGADKGRDSYISDLRSLGLKVLITECDINDTLIVGSIQQRDAAVATCYGQYLSSIIPVADPDFVTFFCFTDLNNWYDQMSGPQYTRADGAPHRPGLLDVNFVPKPAYGAVLAALRSTCGDI